MITLPAMIKCYLKTADTIELLIGTSIQNKLLSIDQWLKDPMIIIL